MKVPHVIWGLAVCVSASCSSNDCRGSLAEVGRGCPATFDGTEAELPACPLPAGSQIVRNCDDGILITFSTGYVGQECFYDLATHALVGADIFSDTPSYCGGSFGKVAGRLPFSSCRSSVPALQSDCSTGDGGAD